MTAFVDATAGMIRFTTPKNILIKISKIRQSQKKQAKRIYPETQKHNHMCLESWFMAEMELQSKMDKINIQ